MIIRASSAMRHDIKNLCVLGGLLLLVPLFAVSQNRPEAREGSIRERSPQQPYRIQRGNTASDLPATVAPNSHDQSPADMDVTKQIRRAVLADETLSPYAHNVKIIVHNGQVTLRGPVRSVEEKAAVEAKAATVVGRNNVRNEVEVSPGKAQ